MTKIAKPVDYKALSVEFLKASRQALFILRQVPTDDMAYAPDTINELERAIAKAEGR